MKNEVLEAPCFKDGSQVASRPPPGSILDRFWIHFGTIFVSFSNKFRSLTAYAADPKENGWGVLVVHFQKRLSKLCNQLGQCWLRKTMSEKLTKMVPKWSQNLSKIDPGGGLEATWEPPLKQGASKTSFLTILAPFWDPLWDQFGVILGISFLMFV